MTNFHLAAFYTPSLADSQTNLAIAGVTDQVLTLAGNNFQTPSPADLLLFYAGGANVVRARLNTPKWRYVGLPSLVPISLGATIPSPPPLYDARNYPLRIDPVDSISLELSSLVVGAALAVGGMWMRYSPAQPAVGPVYRVRGTAAITAAAGTWQNGTITMDQPLPMGRYQVVGMRVVGANLALARLIFPGSFYRPGSLCFETTAGLPHPAFEMGGLGVWGEFVVPNVPNLEILSTGANTAQEVFLDLIRVGDS